MENLGFSEILGIIFVVFPLIVYLTWILFDGLGYIRDFFHFSQRNR